MAEEKVFDLEVITPDRVFCREKAVMVEMNTKEGQLGIYKEHVPTTCILSPGVLTIHLGGGETKKAALHGGFAEIDVNRAEAAKERAESRIQGHAENVDIARAEMALRRALTRLKVVK